VAPRLWSLEARVSTSSTANRQPVAYLSILFTGAILGGRGHPSGFAHILCRVYLSFIFTSKTEEFSVLF